MPYPLQSVLRLGTGLGATLLGSAWLASLPARADLVPTTGIRSLGTSVQMNGLAAPGCSAGVCQVQGGTSRGTNLFHRFDQFDTRSGVTRVDFLNGLQRAVIVGVTSPTGSFINVPVTGQNGAGLFFLSPGGISISGAGGFTGWGDLLLTTKTNLAFGSSQFNAFTTLPDNSPDWSIAPVLASNALSTDPASLSNNGLGGNGAISVAGSLISIDRNLLIDSGDNILTLQNASLSAGVAGTPGIGETSNGGASLKGRTITATDSSLTALRTGLEATDIALTRTAIQAPRGLIDVYATNGITLDASTLSLAPLKVEDLYGPGLGFERVEVILGIPTTVLSNPPGNIRLATASAGGSGIEIRNNSSVNASIELQGPNANPAIPYGSIDWGRAKPFAGNLSVASASQLTVDGSSLRADATDGEAGHIALFNLNAPGNLRISQSTVSASSPLGSGDIDLYGAGGVEILANSRLEANSTGAPQGLVSNATIAFQPAGQIYITNDSPTAALRIEDSQVVARYETSDPSRPSSFVDELDPGDSLNNPAPSPLIRLSSAGGTLLANAGLDAGSGSGFAGTIQIVNGAGGLQVLGSQLSAALTAPPSDPDLVAGGFGVTGRLDLYSQSGISIGANGPTASLLEASSAYDGFQAGAPRLQLINDADTAPLEVTGGSSLLARAGVGALGSEVFLGSKGGITLDTATIDASGGSGGTLTLASTGDPSTTPFSISSNSFLTNLGDGGAAPALPILLTYLDTATAEDYTSGTYFNTFNNDNVTYQPFQYPLPSAADVQAFLSSLAPIVPQTLDERVDAGRLSYSVPPQVLAGEDPNTNLPIYENRQSFLLRNLDVTSRQPETDRIITVNDGIVTITEITQSFQVLGGGTTSSATRFDLSNAADAAALQALIGDGLFNAVVNQTPLAPLNLNAPSGAIAGVTEPGQGANPSGTPPIGTSALLANGPADGTGKGTETGPTGNGAPTAAPSLAVKPADNLDPKKALESLDEGERTSLEAVSQALGIGSALTRPPTILQLQGYMRAAIEALRQNRKSQAWIPAGGKGEAIASVSTDNLLLAKASFDQASYKPAILRYSFTPKPAAAGSAEAGKPPATGLIDIVLVLPDGEPQGWRVEVPIARLREALARHYANMASMGPLPSGNPAASPSASQLAQLLLEPVQATLRSNGVTSLIISSDLNLIDVPYASLPLGGGYLGERYAVTITPSLALTSLTSNEKPPIYGKDSLIRAGATEFANGLAPLPMVEQELTTIAREDGGTVLLNKAFNSDSLLRALADPAVKRIHIASHAELKPGKEGDARIYTSSNSVGLKELGQLRQRQAGQNLDLVSLSACRSAVSGSDLELGFAGMAIQLGAKSAVGTKWYVDDLATSSFFVQFYRYLDQGIPKAEAIQMTQKAFLSGEVHLQGDKVVGSQGSTLMAGLTPSQQRRYASGFSHPYFWAAVQLVGSPW